MSFKKTLAYVTGGVIVSASLLNIKPLGKLFVEPFTRLQDRRFYNADWLQYTPTEQGIWPGYMSQNREFIGIDILHTEYNWAKYKEKVLEENGLKDESDFLRLKHPIRLPHLDGDGKVGE